MKTQGQITRFLGHFNGVISRSFVIIFTAVTAFGASAQTEVIEEQTLFYNPEPENIMLQNTIDNTELMYFGKGEVTDSMSYRELLNQFYEDQFRHSQDPRAPYFMLMSRNGNLAMGIGGELRMVGAYDMHSSIPGVAFVPSQINVAGDPTRMQTLQLTPSRTALFVSVFGNDKRFGKFQIYIHGKFSGDHNTFKLDRAYASVGDWTIGYAKSTFDDPVAQPPTIDIEGPNSESDDSRVLVRYMHSLSSKVTMALSAEAPNNQIPTTNLSEGIASRMPDIGAFVQFASGNQHLRVSGIYRNLAYRDQVTGSNHLKSGWGVNISTKLHPGFGFNIYGAFNMGQGIGNLINDLSYLQTDLLGVASTPGEMYAPRSYGWYGAMQYHYSPSVFSTLIFSQERLLPKGDTIYGGSQYKYGLYATANVFWNITPRVQMGAEFNAGRRVDMDGSGRTVYRASVVADFSF